MFQPVSKLFHSIHTKVQFVLVPNTKPLIITNPVTFFMRWTFPIRDLSPLNLQKGSVLIIKSVQRWASYELWVTHLQCETLRETHGVVCCIFNIFTPGCRHDSFAFHWDLKKLLQRFHAVLFYLCIYLPFFLIFYL